jgi:hypothetical protein
MNVSLRRTGAALAATGALAFALVGCGGSGTQQAASASTVQQQPAGQGQGQGGPDLSALATKLGVSEAKLQSAMQSARPAQGSSPDDQAAALAKALGISEAKVTAAMAATRPSGTPPTGGAPSGQGTPPEQS